MAVMIAAETLELFFFDLIKMFQGDHVCHTPYLGHEGGVWCLMLMLGAAARGWDEAKAIISQKHAAGRSAAL